MLLPRCVAIDQLIYVIRATNLRNAPVQILKVDEMQVVASIIRAEIDTQDEKQRLKPAAEESDDLDAVGAEADADPIMQNRVIFGSVRPETTLDNLEHLHVGDTAFHGLHLKLARALRRELNGAQVHILGEQRVSI